jgi:hypothetical protein
MCTISRYRDYFGEPDSSVMRVAEAARTYVGAAKTPASKKVSMSDWGAK